MNFIDMTPAELDQRIYRIMPQSYVFDMFATGSNVLSSIHKWKDKFENFQSNLIGDHRGTEFSYGLMDLFFGQCWTSDALSEAMWGIYANNPKRRFLRVRSTPRLLLSALVRAQPDDGTRTCFFGKVVYMREHLLQAALQARVTTKMSPYTFAQSLLVKRRAFRHESEMRLLHFGRVGQDDLYRYVVNPHAMVTQIMADPNRDRTRWIADREFIHRKTRFEGEILRSKIYDPPEWSVPRVFREL